MPGTTSDTQGPSKAPVGPREETNPNAGASPAGTLPPPPPVPAGSPGITAAMLALGDSVYHGQVCGGTCMGCHGADAKGSPVGPDLTDDQWLWSDGSLPSIERTITQGVPTPKQYSGVMPPMGGAQLTPAQLRAVAAYVFALSHAGG